METFEELVASIWEATGYYVYVTYGGDGRPWKEDSLTELFSGAEIVEASTARRGATEWKASSGEAHAYGATAEEAARNLKAAVVERSRKHVEKFTTKTKRHLDILAKLA